MRRIQAILSFAALMLACTIAAAQTWPSKPLRIIVGYPPGGVVDLSSRILARGLAAGLGQQVLVENRPGAGSMIGAEYVAKSAPDGYTYFVGGSSSLAINPQLYPKTTLNPLRDFAPITLLGATTITLVVHPSVPAKTARELVQLAAKRPDELNYGSAGIGSTFHIAAALFLAVTNSKVVHIPNKGSLEALTDLVAGRTQLQADAHHVVKPQIVLGKIRPIGVMAAKRSALLPDVPTLAEQGFQGLELSTGTGFVAPAGTPEAILDRMNAEALKVLAMREVREGMAELGLGQGGVSRKDHAAYMVDEYARWGNAVRISGAKVE